MKRYISLLLTTVFILSVMNIFPAKYVNAATLGDLNKDGTVGPSDFMLLQSYLRSEVPDDEAIYLATLTVTDI